MNVPELLAGLQRIGVNVRTDIDCLRLTGNVDRVTDELQHHVRSQKHSIIRHVSLPVFMSGELSSACGEDGAISKLVLRFDQRCLIWCPGTDQQMFLNACRGFDSAWFGMKPETLEVNFGSAVPANLHQLARADRVFCMHDQNRLARTLSTTVGQYVKILDTAELARAAGYPQGLEELASRVPCRISPPIDARWQPKSLQETLFRLLQECHSMEQVFPWLQHFGESGLIQTHRTINDRGISVDRQLVAALQDLSQTHLEDVTRPLQSRSSGTPVADDLQKGAFLLDWFHGKGIPLPNLQRSTLKRLIRESESGHLWLDETTRAVVNAIIVANRDSSSSLRSLLLGIDDDGRVRGAFNYYGCHTGRFSSSGVQLHNLPRATLDATTASRLISVSSDYAAFCGQLPEGTSVDDAICGLRRACFVADVGKTLCIADFHAVEARGLAWCAGETTLLEAFVKGADPYLDTASSIYGRQITAEEPEKRSVGKLAILACGYGMGAEKLEEYAEKLDIDLHAAGTSPEQIVKSYRKQFPRIAGGCIDGWTWVPGIWQLTGQAAVNAIATGIVQHACRCSFMYDGRDLAITLPSNRSIYYRSIRSLTSNGFEFEHPREGWTRTYGGKLVQNIVQGICRDLITECLVECELRGMPVVMHVHDEVVVEAATPNANMSLSQLIEIMSRSPLWAPGLPLSANGYVSQRYGYPDLSRSSA